MENEPMESDADIELQITIYTLTQAICRGFDVPYQKAKEILNKALRDRDNNTAEISAQIFQIWKKE